MDKLKIFFLQYQTQSALLNAYIVTCAIVLIIAVPVLTIKLVKELKEINLANDNKYKRDR